MVAKDEDALLASDTISFLFPPHSECLCCVAGSWGLRDRVRQVNISAFSGSDTWGLRSFDRHFRLTVSQISRLQRPSKRIASVHWLQSGGILV